MRLTVEFTTEPFEGEGEPPAHAVAAHDRLVEFGFTPDFGPLGTSCRGDRAEVAQALAAVLDSALDAGAERITFQVTADRPDTATGDAG